MNYFILYDGVSQLKFEFDKNAVFVEIIDWVDGSCNCERTQRVKNKKIELVEANKNGIFQEVIQEER